MPKVTWSPQYQREKAMQRAVARAKIDLDMTHDYEMAERIGMAKSSFSKYKRENFQNMSFKRVCEMARKLNFTAKEWCAIAGVPYDRE